MTKKDIVEDGKYLTGDAETKRRAELVEKWRLDALNRREGALEEGRIKGRKEGLIEGHKEGLIEGRKEGLIEGRKEYQLMLILNIVEEFLSLGLSTKEAIEQCGLILSLDYEYVQERYYENRPETGDNVKL